MDPKEWNKAIVERYECRNVSHEVVWKVLMDTLRKRGEDKLRNSNKVGEREGGEDGGRALGVCIGKRCTRDVCREKRGTKRIHHDKS
jgi:hypothetical protein